MKRKGWALLFGAFLAAFSVFLMVLIAVSAATDPRLPHFMQRYMASIIIAAGAFIFIYHFGFIEVKNDAPPGGWGTKISLQFRNEAANRMRTLKAIAGKDSEEEIIREALQMYEHLVLEIAAGTRYYHKIPGEKVRRVRFFKYEE